MKKVKQPNIAGEVLRMIKVRIDDEKAWMNQCGYKLSSTRIVNILENLTCNIYELEMEELSKEESVLRESK